MADDVEEKLDTDAAIAALNKVLELQYRSVVQYTLTSGSLFGFEFQSLGDRFWQFAQAELEDARKLVEKVTSFGGEPAVAVADARWSGDASEAVDWIIESETEAIEALREAIEPTGREGRSEALEHLMEHMILRKQDQVDFLMRAQRSA
jgi:bacterioferritin (cytochrome b1)